MKNKLCVLLIIFLVSCLLGGCNNIRVSVQTYSDSSPASTSVTLPVNPNKEKFTMIDSSRTEEDGIVTITYVFKLEEE